MHCITPSPCIFLLWIFIYSFTHSFPDGLMGRDLSANVGDSGDIGSIPGSGRSSGGGNGNPFQYSYLEISMNRGTWWAAARGGCKELDTTERTENTCIPSWFLSKFFCLSHPSQKRPRLQPSLLPQGVSLSLFTILIKRLLLLLLSRFQQSCPTLCDPIDGSPPGSAVAGILQARTLERVAISFSWSRD